MLGTTEGGFLVNLRMFDCSSCRARILVFVKILVVSR